MNPNETWDRVSPSRQHHTYYDCGESRISSRSHTFQDTPPAFLVILAGVIALVLVCTTGCGQRTAGLNRVQSSGILRIAIDPSFPPFESVDSVGQIVGFDADLARALAKGMGVEAHFVTTGYDALYDALTVGRADVIISALYPDPSRTAGFAFSRSYFNAGEVLVVGQESGISIPEDLAGKPVACVFGTAGHMELLRLEKTLTPPPTIIAVDDLVTITSLLHTEAVAAIVIDHVSAQLATSDDPSVRILTPALTQEPYVIAVGRDDAKLLKILEKTLTDLEADGTLAGLTQTWLRP